MIFLEILEELSNTCFFCNLSFEQRVRRMMELHNLNYKQAAHLLVKLDAKHAKYYFDYTGKKWGDAVNYDLCINR
jgi:cytidylate kinase